MITLRYGPADSQVGDLHLPDVALPPVVCLFHGGFWRVPHGRDQMHGLALDLVSRGFAVWNIGYRRVGEPGGGWPGTQEDAFRAMDFLAALPALGLDLSRVAAVGHSAGGHLALCCCRKGRLAAFPHAPVRVAPVAVAALAAITDLRDAFELDSGGGAASALMGGPPAQHSHRYLANSPRALLPLCVAQLVMYGSDDTALPPHLSRSYARAAFEAGDDVQCVEMGGIGHMDFLDPAGRPHAFLCHWLGAVLTGDQPVTR
jgi:acetyl esterase/lipase